MTLRMACWLVGVCFALGACAAPARSDETRFWQEGDVLMFEQAAWKGGIGWKLASEPSSTRLQAWELKPKLQWRLRPGLDSAVTYKFVRNRSGERTQALEFDVTPSWTMGTQIGSQLTQRLSVSWHTKGRADYRHHTIPRIEWPSQWLPAGMTVDTSLEGIYDLRAGQWHESKFSPLRLKVHSNRVSAWSIAYVLNHKRVSPTSWSREHVVQLAVALNATGRKT